MKLRRINITLKKNKVNKVVFLSDPNAGEGRQKGKKVQQCYAFNFELFKLFVWL